ncbi:hypothetical protein FEM48_Zijuj06G0013100 [Ziziphus jujuba var. spinosa]|uniref:Mechanosensitive ion channel protein n=1 Tax=Ziziphus jujuba var. spinosa TaxID=714518 RepID=A0A978V6C2_ZIZJJ|nr:hypothetical protein FEM48_Zijuj06G0013100 [Ziziphus jujuba var. spinosa]
MSQSHRRETVVDIESNGGCSKEKEVPSKSDGEGFPVQIHQGSPEKSAEHMRRRSKEFSSGQENWQQSSSTGAAAEVLRCSSNASFRRNSWKPPLSKTRSRFSDAFEQSCEKSDRLINSGRKLLRKDDENDDRDGFDEDGIEDIPGEYTKTKFSPISLLQWVSLVLIIAALVCSLSIPVLTRQTLWDLPLWKWEIMVLALICGRLVSGWGVRLVVIIIERNFLLRKRVLYFVYGLRRAVQNCLWLGLVLLVWHSIFDDKVEHETKSRILPYVTRILVCLLLTTIIWLLKTLLVKVLALSFHVNTFFERIQEALFSQYVIETLSGPPLFERHHLREEERGAAAAELREFENAAGVSMPSELRATLLPRSTGRVTGSGGGLQQSPSIGKNPRFSRPMSDKQDEKIPIDHLHKLSQKNISAWNMRRMINIIRHGSLTTLDEQIINSDVEDESSVHIRTECQAKEAARQIFLKVAKPGSQYILLEDVMRFMSKDEALKAMQLFGAANENEKISKSSLKDWVVHAFRERKALALSLNDTKTAVDELHNMLNILVAIIIMIIWLLILGIPITQFLVFVSSQLLLVVFIFGNTCRTIFEAIIFLFVMHPFDVGDRCEVEGVQMIVEEMNILTTVFLRYDNLKIIYPNSVLATKPIANYYRSPDMGDAIDFCIHISTPVEKIAMMKERIKGYIESKGEHWHAAPMLIMRDVEDLNKLTLSLWPTHKMNYQDIAERWNRRTHLVEQMIKIFRELDIEYRLLPLDVNVRSMPSSDNPPSNWTSHAARGD